MADEPTPAANDARLRRLLRNRTLLLLWSGQTISLVGDVFFNIAVMWVIYAQSGSALQTSLVQVVWHLNRILFAPFAGIVADRWDRKRIMVVTNFLAALVVGGVASAMFGRSMAPTWVILLAAFVLNGLNTFLTPARVSVMPEIIGRDLLAMAGGIFATVEQSANFLGSALAGWVIAAVGAAWAVTFDALSFLVAALTIVLAALPVRIPTPTAAGQRPSLWQQLREGWQAIADQPVLRALVWLNVLINVPSFLGPLYPALVTQRLQGGAAAFGTIEAVSVIGGMVGGAVAGLLERRLGAGRTLATGWVLGGLATLGMAFSTWLPLTATLSALTVLGFTAGGVAMGALSPILVPEVYRGRVWGIMGALSVIAIPVSAILGGWLADLLGAAALFAIGGGWILVTAGFAWLNPAIRTARI